MVSDNRSAAERLGSRQRAALSPAHAFPVDAVSSSAAELSEVLSAATPLASDFLALWARPVMAPPAAAVNVAMLACLRQRRGRGASGAIRRAAADSAAETLGATVSCRTCPVRSTFGAAQARVLRTPRLANGNTVEAAVRVRAATPVFSLLFLADM